WRLKERKFHFQEFGRILAELVEQQAQIARHASHIVIKLGIVEEFARRAVLGTQAGGGVAQILAGLAPGGEERIVGGQLAERAAARVDVREQGVAIVQKLPRALMEARIEDELPERTFLLLDGAHDV